MPPKSRPSGRGPCPTFLVANHLFQQARKGHRPLLHKGDPRAAVAKTSGGSIAQRLARSEPLQKEVVGCLSGCRIQIAIAIIGAQILEGYDIVK